MIRTALSLDVPLVWAKCWHRQMTALGVSQDPFCTALVQAHGHHLRTDCCPQERGANDGICVARALSH